MRNVLRRLMQHGPRRYDSTAAYQKHLDTKLAQHRADPDLAFAQAIGSPTMDLFVQQGDVTVVVLRCHGLADGMTVYDLGCGSGRTAQALQRTGWQGSYVGADIIADFITHLRRKCSGYDAFVHRHPTIRAEDDTLDMIFHWSVFTHLPPEECFLYLQDSFRALKAGGRIVFSFLEIGDPQHRVVFDRRAACIARGENLELLDTFLHRDWLTLWAGEIGFTPPTFTNGDDDTDHPPFWQTLVAMTKPDVRIAT